MMRPDAKVEKVYLYPKPVDFDFKCPIEMMGQVMQKAIDRRHAAPTSMQ